MRFFHQGQFKGHTKRISPHLGRGPEEPTCEVIHDFYARLLTILQQPVLRGGTWQLLECTPGWEGNPTHDCCLVFAWEGAGVAPLVVAVNYAGNQSQCHVRLPLAGLAGTMWRLQDQLSSARHDWNGADLQDRGLFLDLAPWQTCVFTVARCQS